MGRMLAICALLVLCLSGCAVTRSTESGGIAPSKVYHLNAEQADHVLQQALAEQFPGSPIASVAIPNKGYMVELHFLLDHHTIAAYAVPKSDGYIFEVSSSGSMVVQGEIKARHLFQKIVADAAAAERS